MHHLSVGSRHETSSASAQAAWPDRSHIPGRLGSTDIKVVRLGNADIFFYMTPHKLQAAKDLLRDINAQRLGLTVDVEEDPCLTTEIAAMTSIKPDAVGTDDHHEPVFLDPVGKRVLDEYADRVLSIAKEHLRIPVIGASREINLILSQDAHKFHQDQFKRQYDYLAEHHPMPKCKLFHDLTLVDWDMSVGTVSGTLFQDDCGDRLLISLFPQDALGILTSESPVYPEGDQPPVFPGPVSLPFHAVVSPIDIQGGHSAGSAKGKRISTVVRGLALEQDMAYLNSVAKPLQVNRPALVNGEKRYYEGAMVLKPFPDGRIPGIDVKWALKHPDRENLEILETRAADHTEAIRVIGSMFGLNTDPSKIMVKHLTKRDGGFSKFSLMDLGIPSGAAIVLVNRSILPQNYRYYNIAEDQTPVEKPWIQLYQFEPNMAMIVNPDILGRLSLTPMEELLYRDAKTDATIREGMKMHVKPVTKIDMFVFLP